MEAHHEYYTNKKTKDVDINRLHRENQIREPYKNKLVRSLNSPMIIWGTAVLFLIMSGVPAVR